MHRDRLLTPDPDPELEPDAGDDVAWPDPAPEPDDEPDEPWAREPDEEEP